MVKAGAPVKGRVPSAAAAEKARIPVFARLQPASGPDSGAKVGLHG